MVTREFLGWDLPFCGRVADWLLGRGDELAGLLVIVPTAHSGHRLREALVERADALLAPRIVTPGVLMDGGGDSAGLWMERAAWADTLEAVDDWSRYPAVFPEPPVVGGGWAGALGGDLAKLRRRLQENGHTLESAARRLSGTVEAARWRDLARLERQVERRLEKAGATSRSRSLAGGLVLPAAQGIVVAGVTEMTGLLERALIETDARVFVLIAAPDDEADSFSEAGLPLPCWTGRPLPWPDGEQGAVHLAANPRHEASIAWAQADARVTNPADRVVGATDEECSRELAKVFARHGQLLHLPGIKPPQTGLHRWFKVWSSWLDSPTLATLSDLLALPETAVFPGSSDRARTAMTLMQLRDEWMAIHPDDLRSRLDSKQVRTRQDFGAVGDVLKTAATLERLRRDFTRRGFAAAAEELLETLAASDEAASAWAAVFRAWIAEAAPWIKASRQAPGFWIDLMLAEHPPQAEPPPDDRDGDVLGWLELLFEDGAHLVLCGMNEGKVPPRDGGGAWLGESAVELLGLRSRTARWARDAYLYQAVCAVRRNSGRVDMVSAKSGGNGDSLQPSRLLLAAPREDLPARVSFLFRGVEPPDAGLHWQPDWKWKPRRVEPPKRLAATSLGDYLQCPFRFYLKHCLRMQAPEPDRVEWNARDFGILAHDLLERWGGDAEARDFSKTEAIHDWLVERLEELVAGCYGRNLPLAVRIQKEALAQRLLWFSRAQACSRAEGWEVIDVEHKFSIPCGSREIIAKIDRIDRHGKTGELRVIDYKTGAAKGAAEAHRSKVTAATRELAHLPADSPAFYERDTGKGRIARFRWTNLQLPLYTVAVLGSHSRIARPCYFNLGAAEPAVGIHEWDGYDESDLEAARTCAEWIAGRIVERVFWPPAEKVRYDDCETLAMGRPLEDLVDPGDL